MEETMIRQKKKVRRSWKEKNNCYLTYQTEGHRKLILGKPAGRELISPADP